MCCLQAAMKHSGPNHHSNATFICRLSRNVNSNANPQMQKTHGYMHVARKILSSTVTIIGPRVGVLWLVIDSETGENMLTSGKDFMENEAYAHEMYNCYSTYNPSFCHISIVMRANPSCYLTYKITKVTLQCTHHGFYGLLFVLLPAALKLAFKPVLSAWILSERCSISNKVWPFNYSS